MVKRLTKKAFRGLKGRGVTAALLAAVALGMAGCASPGRLAKAEADYPKDKVDARGLFVENCATCHGRNGRAKTFHGRVLGAQNFTDPAWRAEVSNTEVVHAIRTGPGAMPAFEHKLSDAEINALATYVQTFAAAQ
jgi:mono/diheme cytochrome c family protein